MEEKSAGNLDYVSKQPLKKACHPLVIDNIHLMVTMKKKLKKCKFIDFFDHLFLIINFGSVCEIVEY